MSDANKQPKRVEMEGLGALFRKPWMFFILFVLLAYFLVYIGQPVAEDEWCLLNDYLGYYSAGQIMNAEGAASVYDFDLLGKYQDKLFESCGIDGSEEDTLAMLYLPVFFVPFQVLALINYPASVVTWLVMNVALLIYYLFFFAKQLFGKRPSPQIILMVLVSIPVFRNLIHGQVNLLLLIAMGEFARAVLARKEIKAGLWLGGLMIKPQFLIFLLPFLLIQKKWKALLGFIIATVFLFGASFLAVGWEGILSLKESIVTAANGGGSSHSELMMNWRAVSYYVTQLAGDGTGNAVLIGGSVLTAAVPLVVFRKKLAVDSPMFMVALLGVMAATTLVTYHAHTHSAMILIPLLLYLYLNGQLRERMFNLWFLAPSVFNLTQFLVGALVILSILPFGFGYYVNFSNGLILFVMNFILLGWAVCQARPRDEKLHLSEG